MLDDETDGSSVFDAGDLPAATNPGAQPGSDSYEAGPALEAGGPGLDPSAPTGEAVCPWCSAVVDPDGQDRCPSCGARLRGDPDAAIPGVTSIDPEVARKAAASSPSSRRGLLGLLADPGPTTPDSVQPSSIEALRPPTPAVRHEMEKLMAELAASAAAEAAAEAEAAAAAELEAAAQAVAVLDPAAAQAPADLAAAELEAAAELAPTDAAAEREQPAT